MPTASRSDFEAPRWSDTLSHDIFPIVTSSASTRPQPALESPMSAQAPPGAIGTSRRSDVPNWAGVDPFAPVVKQATPQKPAFAPQEVARPVVAAVSQRQEQFGKPAATRKPRPKRMSSSTAPAPPLPDFKGLFATSASKDADVLTLKPMAPPPGLAREPSNGNLTVQDFIGAVPAPGAPCANLEGHLKRSNSKKAPVRPPRPGSPPAHALPFTPPFHGHASDQRDASSSSRNKGGSEYTFDSRASGGLGIELPKHAALKLRAQSMPCAQTGVNLAALEARKRNVSVPNALPSDRRRSRMVAEHESIPLLLEPAAIPIPTVVVLSALAQRTLHVSDMPRYEVRLQLLEKLEMLLGAPLSMYECEEIFKLGKSTDARAITRTRVRTSLIGMPPSAQRKGSFFGSIKRAFSGSSMDIARAAMTNAAPQVVFGVSLGTIAHYGFVQTKFGGQRYDIPGVCFSAVEEIYRRGQGAPIPGFFRNAGDPTRVAKLVGIYDAAPDYGDGHDLSLESVFDVTALFIKYLAELPDPILDSRIWRLFRFACVDSTMPPIHRVACAQVLLRLLPTAKLSLLIYLVAFLSIVPLFPENPNSLELMASLFGVAIMSPRKVSTSAKFQHRISGGAEHHELATAITEKKSQEGLLWLLRNWGAVAEGVFDAELAIDMDEILAQTLPKGFLEPSAGLGGAGGSPSSVISTVSTITKLTRGVLSPATSPPASPLYTASPAFSLDFTTRWGDLISHSGSSSPMRPSEDGRDYTVDPAGSSAPNSPTVYSPDTTLHDSTATISSHRDSFFPLPKNLPPTLRNLGDESPPEDPDSPDSSDHDSDTAPEHSLPRLSRGSDSTIESLPSSRGGSLTLPRTTGGLLVKFDLTHGGVARPGVEDEFGPINTIPEHAEVRKVEPLYTPLVQSRTVAPAAAVTRPFSTDLVHNVAQVKKIEFLLRELNTSDTTDQTNEEHSEIDRLRLELAALKDPGGERLADMEKRCLAAEDARRTAEENLKRISKQLSAIQGVLGLGKGMTT